MPVNWNDGTIQVLGRIEDHVIAIKNALRPGRGYGVAGKTMKAKKGKRVGGIGHSLRGPKKPRRKGKLTKKKKSRGKR